MRYITTLIATLFISSAYAGEFTISYDHAEYVVDYTGIVEYDDDAKLRELMKKAGNRDVFIFINSPGGSAWGGVGLFDEARLHDNLILVAGADFGAWSAAAMFWMGAEHRYVEENGGVVGFHLAYCNPYNPPGCDTTEIDDVMMLMFADVFGTEAAEIMWAELLNQRDLRGVSGWVGIINDAFADQAWFTFNSSLTETEPFSIEG